MKSSVNNSDLFKGKKGTKLLSIPLVGLLLITIMPLSGCSQSKTEIVNDEVEKNILKWRESEISDYNFVIVKYVGNANYMPSLIQVRGGRVTSNEMLGVKPMNTYLQIDDFETVEEAFELIRKAYNDHRPVKVAYSKEFGYPERIAIKPKGSFHSTIIDITKFEIVR